jgi:TRAP-type mannitol/chloroaromatic compound transport system substrate-binding protein
MINPSADERLGFQEVCEFYYTNARAGFGTCGVDEPRCLERDDTCNLRKSFRLQPTHQWSLSQSNYNNGAALDRLKCSGVKVLEFPSDVLRGTAAAGALDELWMTSVRTYSVKARKLQCGPPTLGHRPMMSSPVSAHASWASAAC